MILTILMSVADLTYIIYNLLCVTVFFPSSYSANVEKL